MEKTPLVFIPWEALNSNGYEDIKVGEGIKVGDVIARQNSRKRKQIQYYSSPVISLSRNGIIVKGIPDLFIKNGTAVKIKRRLLTEITPAR